jgi:hypothetical protein
MTRLPLRRFPSCRKDVGLGRQPPARRSAESQNAAALPLGASGGLRHHREPRTRIAHLHRPWRAILRFFTTLFDIAALVLRRRMPHPRATDSGRESGRANTAANDPGCSLIPGLRSRLSKHILAGFMVLSAVGACPPHDGVG